MAITQMPMRAVFLDKDGTLVENVPYNVDPDQIVLTAGAADGLRILHGAGFRLFVVSNQSGVARGYFPEHALLDVHDRLESLFSEIGVPLAGFLYCPHHPDGIIARYAIECDCRKPRPGLLHRAAEERSIDLTTSWLVGDILDDVEAGVRAGCRTVLLDCGGETEWNLAPARVPDVVVRDLRQAAVAILERDLRQAAGALLEREARATSPESRQVQWLSVAS
jgi:D-glycero-D-manno-heptose 1,7-bisphosphate phosphatase